MIAGLGQPHSAEAKAADFARKYGSLDRVQWVQRQPSVVSGKTPCVNAHVSPHGESGVGYKADARWIVPLTDDEHREETDDGIETFCARRGITVDQLRAFAPLTEERWQSFLLARGPIAW